MLRWVMLLAMCGSVGVKAEVAALRVDGEGKLLVKDQPLKLWGLRVACTATKEESTQQLIGALAELKENGINALLICYQGGNGLTQKVFTPDGATFEDTGARDRVRRIIDAAGAKDMVVIVSLFFPRKMGIGGQDPKLASRAAYVTACKTAAEELKDRKNVILAVLDQPMVGAFTNGPIKFTPADVIECMKAAEGAAPNLLRGGGSAAHDANLQIAKSESASVILHAEAGANPPVFAGVRKPIIHVGYFGTNETAGKNPQGFYPPPAKQPFVDLLDRYMDASTAHIVAHFPAWTEGGMDLKPNRFDLGGQGTQKDPGLMWYVEAVHKRTRKKEERPAATPGVPLKPGKSIFDN
jgi:hypothetical protein